MTEGFALVLRRVLDLSSELRLVVLIERRCPPATSPRPVPLVLQADARTTLAPMSAPSSSARVPDIAEAQRGIDDPYGAEQTWR